MYTNIKLLPNPAKAYSVINIKGEFNYFEIYNLLGEKINQKTINRQIYGLPKGVYFVKFDNNYIIKLIVK